MHNPEKDGKPGGTRPLRIKLLILIAACCAAGAAALMPRAIETGRLLILEDDPAALAETQLARSFDAPAATREIEAALAAKDSELAGSFVELARAQNVPVAPELEAKVTAAQAADASASSKAQRFARGFISGEPDDVVSLAGTALGDLFVFGDIRDAVREGARWASGEQPDRLILGLSAVGIAITAGTYAMLGTGAPARVGLSVVKAARKTGRLGARLGDNIARAMRGAVDWSALRRALAGASLTEPAVAVRAAREAVKVEKAGGLIDLVKDVGRVQTKAGTGAALDGLKLAETPKEMGRIAKVAEKQGGKTRAVLKFLGRGAIALTFAVFDVALWLLFAAFALFGFVSSAKSAVERITWRHLQKRKARRARRLALASSQG